jgi:UDP-GlcNAc3NAcA epimerase
LLKENIDTQKIIEVGDIMYDVAKHYQARATKESHILADLKLTAKNYVLATIHRQENTDEAHRLAEIIAGLKAISQEVPVIFPLHPRTKDAITNLGLLNDLKNSSLKIIDPIGYLDMVQLETHAKAIATDSGGIQKEAYFFHVPCLTIRNETEWNELVEHGFNRLVPANSLQIHHHYSEAIATSIKWVHGLYGEGNSAELITQELIQRAKS